MLVLGCQLRWFWRRPRREWQHVARVGAELTTAVLATAVVAASVHKFCSLVVHLEGQSLTITISSRSNTWDWSRFATRWCCRYRVGATPTSTYCASSPPALVSNDHRTAGCMVNDTMGWTESLQWWLASLESHWAHARQLVLNLLLKKEYLQILRLHTL